jgi:hypothetical protein
LVALVMPVSAETTLTLLELPQHGWRFVADGVMGGVSSGGMEPARLAGRDCLRLNGEVSTRNNGGFIQMARDLEDIELPDIATYAGVRLLVRGNDEDYNLHLRTRDLWFPWQAYRATFHAGPEWQTVKLPFADFKPYKTSAELDTSRLRRVGIVAIGRDFTAELCVAEVGFYRE